MVLDANGSGTPPANTNDGGPTYDTAVTRPSTLVVTVASTTPIPVWTRTNPACRGSSNCRSSATVIAAMSAQPDIGTNPDEDSTTRAASASPTDGAASK